MRVPATDPQHPCYAGTPACLARQIFRPGRRFTVPGTVRLRVLRGGGPLRVATTLARPLAAVARRRPAREIVRPAGGAPVLALSLRAAAAGAGIARVEVEQGGTVSAVDPDTIPGLVKGARGRGTIRVALGAAPVARVRALDAAGNASPWADVALAAVPARAGATVSWDPGLGPFDAAATLLSAGQVVTVRGRTDPALAGAFVYFEAIGSALEAPEIQVAPTGRSPRRGPRRAPGCSRSASACPSPAPRTASTTGSSASRAGSAADTTTGPVDRGPSDTAVRGLRRR